MIAPTLPDTVLDTAHRALAGFAKGAGGGGFDDFLDVLTDDIEFLVPVGEPKRYVGKDAVAGFLSVFGQIDAKLEYEAPFRTLRGGDTVAFEYVDHGVMLGKPYHNVIAISLDVRDGRVAAYREYWGEIDPMLIAALAAGDGGA